MAIHRYTKKSKEMGKGMKLIKKDFNKWDREELSIIIKGYTAKDIADYILDMQVTLDKLRKLDMGNVFRYTGTKSKDMLEKHNDTINEIVRLLK